MAAYYIYNKKPLIFIIENDEVTLTRTRTTKTDGTSDIHNHEGNLLSKTVVEASAYVKVN